MPNIGNLANYWGHPFMVYVSDKNKQREYLGCTEGYGDRKRQVF